MKTRLYISFAILSSLFLFFYQQTHVVFGGQNLIAETEANDTAATANPLAGNDIVVTGSISPNSDMDFFSFTANANDRVYAATQTGFSADDRDTVIEIMNTNGTTVLEKDDDAGSLSGQSSSGRPRPKLSPMTPWLAPIPCRPLAGSPGLSPRAIPMCIRSASTPGIPSLPAWTLILNETAPGMASLAWGFLIASF
jgi:hypothetical protein